MEQDLYDSQGYEVKLIMNKTFNPSKAGVGEDTRDLGVFINYLGAVTPEYEGITYEKDSYVFSRLEFPFMAEWNYHVVRDSWGPEDKGVWISPLTRVYLRDTGIRKSGLKIVYYVPDYLANIGAYLKVYVNDDLLKDISLNKAGTFTEIMDVSDAGKETKEYLEKAHRILKILLIEFDRVCQKYNLHYFLICGSLLGAVRHQNFIPWDDDLDVAMPRKDFELLLKHVKDEWRTDGDFMFLNYNEMGKNTFLDYMTRLVYMKEEIPLNIYRKIKGKGRSDVDNHLPMDIYVLDNASDNDKFHQLQTQLIRGLYGLAMGHRAYVNFAEYENRDIKTQKIVRILSTIGKIFPASWIFGCYEWIRKWNKNKKCTNYFESNGFIYCIPWKFKQEWFGDGIRLKLGDMMVNAPKNYKAFLNMHYGDYTQYPPMDVRKPTHSKEASGIY